jgi:hypothetical protein
MEEVQIRMATAEDAEALAHHRSSMFQDMGLLPDGVAEQLRTASIEFFRSVVGGGEWFGWVASIGEATVGGGVLHLTTMPPRNGPGGVFIPSRA